MTGVASQTGHLTDICVLLNLLK